VRFALALAASLAVTAAHGQARPQLPAEQAAAHTAAAYLGDWKPAPLADLAAAPPDFIVKPGESVQAAIDKVPSEGSKRWVIQIQPGTYRGPLCIKDKAPVALVGSALDAAAVVLVDNRFSGKPKAENEAAHPCWPEIGKTTIGTSGSTSVLVQSNDVQLISLTIANDAMDGVRRGEAYPPGVGEGGGAQAVALTLAGDRIQLEGVHLLGHQDTLYAKRPNSNRADAPARQLIRHSLISGDVDFIFGNAVLVIEHSTILTRANRRTPGHGGIILAPSTAPDVAQGFLVVNSRLVGESGIAPGATALGRAWDAGVKAGTWTAGSSPNGVAVIRDSEIGAHVGPWSASTSRRPFDAASNRLSEFNNRP
jgi:pectinesterase